MTARATIRETMNVSKWICILYVFCEVAVSPCLYTRTLTCELKKIFCHEGGTITDRVVCYFDKKPQVKVEKKQTPQQAIFALHIPCTLVHDQELKESLQRINTAKQENYQITIHTRNQEGISIIISYDPRKIICDYDVRESISQYESIIITCHKKDVLETLKVESDKVLKHACLPEHTRPKKIMVDCGHGGRDPGKIGYEKVIEKDINLSIGKHVEILLKQRGYCVEFTRMHDTFVALDERTSQSNKRKADIFLSIHANASSSDKISGIETYWTEQSLLSKNFFPQYKNLEKILVFHDVASKLLADHIHKQVLLAVAPLYPVNDRKVKQAVSQVLLGTEMPAALMELGFLSNPEEAKLLRLTTYQKKLAHGICEGIDSYFKDLRNISVAC